jgi:hypothetical protein
MMFRGMFAASLVAIASLPLSFSFQVSSPTASWGVNTKQQKSLQPLQMSASTKKMPGTAKLDTPWEELGFEIRPTNSHVRVTYKNGEWGQPELVKVRTHFVESSPKTCAT